VASKSLVEDLVGELENEYVVCCVLSGCLASSSRGWGVRPPFIDQGGGGLHARRAI
jgi:hypothetical protein